MAVLFRAYGKPDSETLQLLHILAAVGLGGALGSLTRFFFIEPAGAWPLNPVPPPALLAEAAVLSDPLGTFAANVLGCLLLGLAVAWGQGRRRRGSTLWAPFLGGGYCGGLTTFSGYSLDSLALYAEAPLFSAMNLATHLVVGYGAFLTALVVGRRWWPPSMPGPRPEPHHRVELPDETVGCDSG